MQKEKGFTLVEIIVTFCLVSTISFLLFQLILSLKNLYTNSDYRTVLLIEQGNMTRRINTDLFSMPLVSVDACKGQKGVKKCIVFTLEDTAVEKNVTRQLEIYEDEIIYDGYTMPINNGSKLGDVSSVVSYVEDASVKYNSILTIDIPVSNKLSEGDYGIHVTVQYNSVTTDIDDDVLDDYRKIEIVTTTVSDIEGKVVTEGDGLYRVTGSDWYDSKNTNLPKYVFKGESPNNYVIFNKRCYRIMSITVDSTVKMVYDGQSDGNGRCTNIVNDDGSDTAISKEEWNSKDNNWLGTTSLIRSITLPDWLKEQNANTNRLSNNSNFYVGALTGTTDTLATLWKEQMSNKGSSSLPIRNTYTDHEYLIGLPMVSDYILASLNDQCISMAQATSTTECKEKNYMQKAYDYWTMNADASGTENVWTIGGSGSVESVPATDTETYVRPVIYLKSTTKFSGAGTTSNPYVVK